MKIPPKIAVLITAGCLSAASALAGTFSTTFSEFTGYTPYGSAFTETNRGIMTIDAVNQAGSFSIWDFDGGQPIESFTASFQLQLGPGSGNAADGTSFNFGPGVFDGLVSTEEGPGGEVITIEFDTYDNGGGEAPAIDVRYHGVEVAHHAMLKTDMITSKLENVVVQLDRAGTVTVTYKGQVIHDHVFLPGWAPAAGLFNFSARTGGEYAYQAIANMSLTTVLAGTAVAPTVTTPANVTVNEGATTNFNVTVGGSAPFTFQWFKDGFPIQDATSASLTLGPIHYTDNGSKVKVQVTNPNSSVTSGEATVNVIRDTTAPTVVKAAATQSGSSVIVTYSEPVSDTALVTGYYSINQGITISGVSRMDASRVALSTSQMPGGQTFILTINNVQDTASSPANTIAANTHVSFNSFLFQLGAVIHKKYLDATSVNSTPFSALLADPRYPNNPDRQDVMGTFEYPAGGSGRDSIADPGAGTVTYSDTLETYFIPQTSGDYVIYAEGADLNDVWLSTDSDPNNTHNVAQCNGWTNPRDWNVSQCGTSNGLRSDWYTANSWPTAGDPSSGQALINLTAGVRYYMIAFHHRDTWSGGDEFGVTFKLTSQAPPASGEAPALTGSVVGTYLDPTGASINFAQQPANATVLQGRAAKFSAVVTGQSAYGTNVTYQWQSAPSGSSTFTDISGATAASYTTPALGLADAGRKYQVRASVPGLSQVSTVATVTVNADTIPPHLVTAASIASSSGSTMDVGITFDEPVTQVSAETLSHYSISSGTISAAKYYAGSPGVVLTVSGLTAGSSVTVQGVADAYGNVMPSATMPLTASSMHWGVVGADELALGNGVIATGPNSFDIYSDGIGEWATYDETTFVYEQVSGDFDKELRVEYQDPSSQWARAGLIARDVPNFGVDRATQATTAGRYQKLHVNPVTTAMGTPGNNSYEGNRRLTTGGATDSPGLNGPGAPAYPNAWCRLKRTGQAFTLYRSSDGVNWSVLATSTFSDPLPTTMYVGPEYTPENGNVDAALRRPFLTKFRDYRTHSDVVAPPVLTYQGTANGMTITFEGTLQSATSITGTFGDMSVTSPYVVPIGSGPMFFRAKK